MIVQIRGELYRFISIALVLFALSELVHKVLLFTDTLVTAAHIFVILSRVAIYIWISVRLSSRMNLLPFLGLITLLSLYEYIFLGSISLMVLSLMERQFLLLQGLIGLSVTFPAVLIFTIVLSSVVFLVGSRLKANRQG